MLCAVIKIISTSPSCFSAEKSKIPLVYSIHLYFIADSTDYIQSYFVHFAQHA